jgi:hypothetical protein
MRIQNPFQSPDIKVFSRLSGTTVYYGALISVCESSSGGIVFTGETWHAGSGRSVERVFQRKKEVALMPRATADRTLSVDLV